MGRFDECLKHILKSEGGYVDHPADRGQATNKGITQATFDSWNLARNLPIRPVREITDFEVNGIYRARYWNVCRCDDLPQGLDLVVFDSAVQHGPARAIKWLQYCVAVAVDGVCGDQTLFAVKQCVLDRRVNELIEDYMDGRAAFYQGIIARDPSQKVFQRGWANRMNTLQEAIA